MLGIESAPQNNGRMSTLENVEALRYLTRAEIAFDSFPCAPCAYEFQKTIRSTNGVIRILFDSCVRRVTVFFDPEIVDIPRILSTLDPFSPNPRVISVTIPMKKVEP